MVTSTNRRQPGLVIPRLSNFVVFIKLAHFHNRSETYHGPNVYTRVFLRSDILYVSGISSIYSFEMISRDHIIHSFIIIREVLILTLSIFIAL